MCCLVRSANHRNRSCNCLPLFPIRKVVIKLFMWRRHSTPTTGRGSEQSSEPGTTEGSSTDAESQTRQREGERVPQPVLVRAWMKHQNFHRLLAMCIC